MEQMERKEADGVTRIQEVIAGAQSEFAKHREAIEGMGKYLQRQQENYTAMAVGLRAELDEIKAGVAAAQLNLSSGSGSSGPVSQAMRAELDMLHAELTNLKANAGAGSFWRERE